MQCRLSNLTCTPTDFITIIMEYIKSCGAFPLADYRSLKISAKDFL